MLKTLSKIASIGIVTERPPPPDEELRVRPDLDAAVQRVLGRALCIRHVDAGSCNGCELEIHALNNPIYNLEGANIRFVASPRHADMLLVTGPVAANMVVALRRTWEATPEPKLVVATGDCACSGGIFGESYASYGRVSNVIPVDVAVPGCPPAPARILQAILTAITVQERGGAGLAAAPPLQARPAAEAGASVGTEAFTAPPRLR
jgi:Ni,Fe-hydrogenase III small subunit